MPSAIGLKSEVKYPMRLSPRLYVLTLENGANDFALMAMKTRSRVTEKT
jgi:hypothetical protein